MAGRDNVLFSASVSSGDTAGTVIPLSLLYGIENVRQGYGTPKLKNVRAFFSGCYTTDKVAIPIEIKNSNWIDSAGLVAQKGIMESTTNKANLSYMRGRDKVLAPNTSWTIGAKLVTTTNAAGYIYVLLEIEYSDVAGINTEDASGSPVIKSCENASVTAAVNTIISIGTFDNLLQNVQYVMSEVAAFAGSSPTASECLFVVVEGFSNQRGLTRIFMARQFGIADQIEGSVVLTKQTYNVSIISSNALSAAAVKIQFEMIASTN